MAGLVLGTLAWSGNALIARASAGILPRTAFDGEGAKGAPLAP